MDDYCLASKTKISEEHKNLARKIIEERRNFILSIAGELREHPEIKDVMSDKWHPGKYPQTGRSVDIEDREKPKGAGDEYFPSPRRSHNVAISKPDSASQTPEQLFSEKLGEASQSQGQLSEQSLSALGSGVLKAEVVEQKITKVHTTSASTLFGPKSTDLTK